MNRDNGTESSFIAGLLRDVDLTASPLRLFVTGTDASARPPSDEGGTEANRIG